MKALILSSLLSCLASAAWGGECVAPPAPVNLPNGASADRETMLAAMKAIETYKEAVETFEKCLPTNTDGVARANQAIDALHRLADQFNAQLRVFKSRSNT